MTDRRLTDAQIDDLALHLQGTCKDLNAALVELGLCGDSDAMTTDDCMQLDDKVFQCTDCGWWDEVGEMSANSEGCCRECTGEDE